jgi:hypothetical protein
MGRIYPRPTRVPLRVLEGTHGGVREDPDGTRMGPQARVRRIRPRPTRARPGGDACQGQGGILKGPMRTPPWACGVRTFVPHACASLMGRTKVRAGHKRARPSCVHHHGRSHRGPVRSPTEAFTPLMMGCALYKGAHTLAPPHFHLDPGPATAPLLAEILGGSLRAYPHLLPFFHSN